MSCVEANVCFPFDRSSPASSGRPMDAWSCPFAAIAPSGPRTAVHIDLTPLRVRVGEPIVRPRTNVANAASSGSSTGIERPAALFQKAS
jgi:hypothetical protein